MEKLLAFLLLVGAANSFFFADPAFQLNDKTMMDNPFWKNFEKGMKQIEASLRLPNENSSSEDSEGDYSEHSDVGFEEPLIPNIFSIISRKPWWKGKNVCVTKEETDLSEKENTTESTPSFFNSLTTRTEACSSKWGRYECVTSVRGPGKHVKTTVRYECCQGHQLRSTRCEFVQVSSLMDTVKETAPEFSRMMETTGMMDNLMKEEGNFTLFLTGDDTLVDLRDSLQEINQLARRRRELIDISDKAEGNLRPREGRAEFSNVNPALNKVLMNHVVKGSHQTFDMINNELLTTLSGSKLRVNIFPGLLSRVVTVNCARITVANKAADRGVVHMVDGVLRPVEQTIAQIIQEDERFTTFRSLLERNGLMEKLNDDGITVFAPTNEAFNELSSSVYEGECSEQVARHHITSDILCLSAMADEWIVQALSGERFQLKASPLDGISVNGQAKVTQKDLVGTNGVVHVIDKAIVPDSGKSLSAALSDRNLTTFKSLLEEAGLLEKSKGLSWFVPRQSAFETPEAKVYLDSVKNDKEKLRDLLMFHSTQPEITMQNVTKGEKLTTRYHNQTLRFGVNYMPTMLNNLLTVNCALVKRTETKACGAAIHEVDRILVPPTSNVMDSIRDRPEFSNFNKIIKKADLENYLTETDGITLLAPTDEAFHDLTVRALNTLLADSVEAKKLVEQHILSEPICCKSVSGEQWFWRQEVPTKSGRRVHARRDFNNNVHFGGTRVIQCDQVALNGVVHTVNKVMPQERISNGYPFGMGEFFKHSAKNPNIEVMLYGI